MLDVGLPRWHSGIESACQCRRRRLIPGQGRSPGEGNGNLLKYSCLENSMDRGAWQSMGSLSDTTKSLTCLLSLQLIYNVILTSGIQRSDSVIIQTDRQVDRDVCVLFFRFFFSIIGYYKILNIVPCAIIRLLLFILYIIVCIC